MKGRETKRNTEQRRMPSVNVAFFIVISMTVLLGLTINFRAYQTMKIESTENDQLSIKAKSLSDENLQLQEEVNDLKTDRRAVEREAKRLGISLRPN